MNLSTLADYFERLDALTSRNAMIEVLGELFAEAEPDEIRELVYLTEGILLPAYEATEIGISEQLMARAVSEAADVPVDEVKALYRKIGDYGSVAEGLMRWEGGKLSVSEAYDALLAIARTSGKGSVEAKVSGLAELIRRMGPKEARYVLRIPIGKLRLGVGDPTIMDGLARGDRHLRGVIEHAYNLCGDMGLVAHILVTEGPKRLADFEVRVGMPIRVELADRTDTISDILTRLGRCALEPKYDGFRCQVHKDGDEVHIFTRNLENATDMFPEILAATRRQVKAERAIFEGEAVSYDPETGEFHPFQVTVRRKRKHLVEEKEAEFPLRLMAFDCLYRDGKEVMYEPYAARREVLTQLIAPDETIQVTEAVITDSASEAESFFLRALSEGLEGLMAKNLDSPYRAGRRTRDWIKFKRSYEGLLRDTIDCVIVGYFAGRGKRASWGIGSILCAVYNDREDRFETITRVASGLPDQGWIDLKATLDEIRTDDIPARVVSVYRPAYWVEPRYVAEVLADEISLSPSHTAGRDGGRTGFALRFPRIVTAILPDRKPEDATTVGEVRRLYELQRTQATAEAA
ncbi:MAG: ATP-dependent DNA ligase [Armatimonadota bacterium]